MTQQPTIHTYLDAQDQLATHAAERLTRPDYITWLVLTTYHQSARLAALHTAPLLTAPDAAPPPTTTEDIL